MQIVVVCVSLVYLCVFVCICVFAGFKMISIVWGGNHLKVYNSLFTHI